MDPLRQPHDDDRPDDDDHPAPAKFLDLAEAVIEHHRYVSQADDDRDPYDAAVLNLIRRFNLDHFGCGADGARQYTYDVFFGDPHSVAVLEVDGTERHLPLDPPGDGR